MREYVPVRVAVGTGTSFLRFQGCVIGTGLVLGADATVEEGGFEGCSDHSESVERITLQCQVQFDEAPGSNPGTPTNTFSSAVTADSFCPPVKCLLSVLNMRIMLTGGV
jgi:hypothetical protein